MGEVAALRRAVGGRGCVCAKASWPGKGSVKEAMAGAEALGMGPESVPLLTDMTGVDPEMLDDIDQV